MRAGGAYYLYTYDPIGQVTVGNSSTSSENRGYAYDAAWNLNYLTNNGALGTFLVDGKNQLTNAYGAGYGYDGNGNLTAGDSSHNAYVYDDENRLVQWFWYETDSSHLTNGALRTDFYYDGMGRLRERLEFYIQGPGQSTNPTSSSEVLFGALSSRPPPSWTFNYATLYFYDGWRVIQERDSNNVPQVSYTRGLDLSGSLEGAGGIGGLLARSSGYSSGNWTSHAYYHADGNGNITCLIASNQSQVASYRYDPYGNTVSQSGTLAGANVYRFSSKEVHTNSFMYYYGYRFYDSGLQRWINRDPIQEQPGLQTKKKLRLQAAAGWNLYQFCFNVPNQLVDSDGKSISHIVSETGKWIGLGGHCCNKGSQTEWYLDNGVWNPLPPGICTGATVDCDGLTCQGQFYSVSFGGNSTCGGGKCTTQPPSVPTGTFSPPRGSPPVDRGPGWTPGDGLHPSPGDRGAPNLPPGYVWPM